MDTLEKSAIKGKHIAITGSLLFYKRQEAFELIRGLGGIPQENVTKETDYLVVGHYRKNTIIGDKSNKRILAERYIGQGCGISSRYRQCQIKASVSVNRELIQFYWSLGKDIVEREAEKQYGSGFYTSFSKDLKKAQIGRAHV